MFLPKQLKDAATAAFRDNSKVLEMSAEDRELAAQGYEQIAQPMLGAEAELARLYNLEQAKFLRGQGSRIASKAREFANEIGHLNSVKPSQSGDQV